jgi:hypothetical protein
LRLRRTGPNVSEIVANDRDDRLPDGFGLARIATRLLFNHPFEQTRHEGHAARLDRLQIARCEQPRYSGISSLFVGIVQDVAE